MGQIWYLGYDPSRSIAVSSPRKFLNDIESSEMHEVLQWA